MYKQSYTFDKHPRQGAIVSEETRKKISSSNKGKARFTDSQKEQMSVDRSGSKHWNYGRKWSEEAKQKNRESNIKRRKENFGFLKQRLKSCQDFFILPESTNNSDPSWFGFLITIKADVGINRIDLINYLTQHRIGTRLLFAGNLTKQPYFKNKKYRISGGLSNTDFVMNNSFWIGVYPNLNEIELSYIADKIETFLGLNFS